MKTTGAKVAKSELKVVEPVDEINRDKVVDEEDEEVVDEEDEEEVVDEDSEDEVDSKGVPKVTGVISDHIHAKIPGKLEKGMKIMNKANKIMGYIPRDFSEDERFEQGDISEGYSSYFEERDDIALENREEFYFEAYERDTYERYDLD